MKSTVWRRQTKSRHPPNKRETPHQTSTYSYMLFFLFRFRHLGWFTVHTLPRRILRLFRVALLHRPDQFIHINENHIHHMSDKRRTIVNFILSPQLHYPQLCQTRHTAYVVKTKEKTYTLHKIKLKNDMVLNRKKKSKRIRVLKQHFCRLGWSN